MPNHPPSSLLSGINNKRQELDEEIGKRLFKIEKEIKPVDYIILGCVKNANGNLNVSNISNEIDEYQSRVSKSIDRLVGFGLIKKVNRSEPNQDRRMRTIQLRGKYPKLTWWGNVFVLFNREHIQRKGAGYTPEEIKKFRKALIQIENGNQ